METVEAGPRPVAVGDRIENLDVLRGVAICGILLMNIPYMGMLGIRAMPDLPYKLNVDWIAWGVQSVSFEGTMRGLFTMLFGAGMLLMLRRAEGADPQVSPFDVWARRCWALMGLGLVQLIVLMWPGEILVNYGIAGLFLLAVRTAKPRALLAIAAVLIVAQAIPSMRDSYDRMVKIEASVPAAAAKAAGKTLTDDQKDALKAVEDAKKFFHPDPKDLAKEAQQRTSFPGVLAWSWETWQGFNVGSATWYLGEAESLAFMMIGMALFRSGLLTGQGSARTYVHMMVLGYGLGIAWRLFELWWGWHLGFELVPSAAIPWLSSMRAGMYEPARLAVTFGHVGALSLAFRAGWLGRAAPLRALGRMALTVYTLESLLTSILFYAMGWVGTFGFAALMGIAGVIWVLCGLFCSWWLSRFEMGPAEELLRMLAYGRFERKNRRVAESMLAAAPSI